MSLYSAASLHVVRQLSLFILDFARARATVDAKPLPLTFMVLPVKVIFLVNQCSVYY